MTTPSKPFFSIIIPSFKSERFIGAAIASALAQTFRDIEVIVVDQQSNDGTVEIVKSYAARDPRVHYADQTGERGPARARNQGLEMAQGEYVTFFDSDNILLPHACGTVKALIDAGTKSDVYFANIHYFESNTPNRLLSFSVQGNTEVTLERLVRQNFINLLGTFIRRDVITRAGGFDNRFRTCEEHILWLRLLLRENAAFHYIPSVFGHLRFHTTNLTWRKSYFIEAAETNFVIYDWLEKEVPLLADMLRTERAKWYFRGTLGGVVMKNRATARSYFDKWCDAAQYSSWVRRIGRFALSVAPLWLLSPLIMRFRRMFVMRQYVPA